MPRHDARGLALPGDAADRARNFVQACDAMKDAGDTLELVAKPLESLQPALQHLAPHDLGRLSGIRRARRRKRLEETARLGHLPAYVAEELGAGGHGGSRSFQRSLNVRDATGGRSRV